MTEKKLLRGNMWMFFLGVVVAWVIVSVTEAVLDMGERSWAVWIVGFVFAVYTGRVFEDAWVRSRGDRKKSS